jgi:hypothetical protein
MARVSPSPNLNGGVPDLEIGLQSQQLDG